MFATASATSPLSKERKPAKVPKAETNPFPRLSAFPVNPPAAKGNCFSASLKNPVRASNSLSLNSAAIPLFCRDTCSSVTKPARSRIPSLLVLSVRVLDKKNNMTPKQVLQELKK